MFDIYEKGLSEQPKGSHSVIVKIMKLVSRCGPEFNFTTPLKEVSGFTCDQKNKIFQILTTFGIPIAFNNEEPREDWVLLQNLLDKHLYGSESLPDTEKVNLLEKFVLQMDIVSAKIIKDYNEPIKKVMMGKKATQSSSSSSSSE